MLMGEMRNTEFYSENMKGRNYFGDTGINRRIILKQILEMWNGFVWLRIGFSGGFF
jgi:hypothetical protein